MKARHAKRRVRSLMVWRGKGWGPTTYVRKRALWSASTSDLRSTGYLLRQEQAHRAREREALFYDQAYEQACELDSPNSIGFDALQERIFNQLLDQS